MFDLGSKVLCVNGHFPREVLNYLRNLPQEGTVYTVRDIIPAQGWQTVPDKPGPETCAVLLREVLNPPAPHRKQWGECGFNPQRFRELTPDEALAVAVLEENGAESVQIRHVPAKSEGVC